MSMFERDDWTLFRNLSTISQKAGVDLSGLRAVVLKELADNALDATGGDEIEFGDLDGGGYFIQDAGPGVPGSPEDIARLFSIRRPLTSSKMLRLPTRGALGNGLRVVAGSVLASEGWIRVATRGQRINLELSDDGSTAVREVSPSAVNGTRVELFLGDAIPNHGDPWRWVRIATAFRFTKLYSGRTSPWWYDSDSFYELLLAARGMDLAEVLAQFTTFRGDAELARKTMAGIDTDLNRGASDALLGIMRDVDKPIPMKAMGGMSKTLAGSSGSQGYAQAASILEVEPSRGNLSAVLPYVIEAVAVERGDDERDVIVPMVNGTPIVGEMSIHRDGKIKVNVFGCGLAHEFAASKKHFTMMLNVIIPYMPITTDGKEPDFSRFSHSLAEVLTKASRKLKREVNRTTHEETATQAEILERHLWEAVAKASGDGAIRFSLRQLYYKLRPYILEEAPDGKRVLDYNYFCKWVGAWEEAHKVRYPNGIPGMFRDPRGTLYHPHTHESIALGTIAVEEYRRPLWTFNKVLYIEKEGLFQVLIDTKFPERYDCALLTSKGFTTRAVRDLIDLLGEDGVENIHVMAIHDADAYGTMIFQTMTEETIARGSRTIPVHNLGLEPWEALSMGLQVETFEERKKRTPVARYVREHEADSSLDLGEIDDDDLPGDDRGDVDGYQWERWLQRRRVELDSMSSPDFVAWLEAKLEDLENRKVIPPRDVMAERLRKEAEASARAVLTERILKEAKFEEQVKKKLEEIAKAPEIKKPEKLETIVREALEEDPVQHWSGPVIELARKMVLT